MTAREEGTFKNNPWPIIGWGTAAGIIVVAGVIGFGLLDRYQPGGPTLGLWSGICRGLGITSDAVAAAEPQPALRTPTRIAWTSRTLDQIAAGDAKHGAFIAMNCEACHGKGGVSTSALFPKLAGMDAAVTYKQLDDFRSGKRVSGVMSAMAKALSAQDSADAAAYFAAQPGGLPFLSGDRVPQAGRSLRESDPGKRLVFAGDPERGIPPCSSCHGPGGYKLGAPALEGQHSAYIEQQLGQFAQGTRANDILEQMRVNAKLLTPDEMHAVAAFYSALAGNQGRQGLASR